jgi:murein L,D-transpeptidase YafK
VRQLVLLAVLCACGSDEARSDGPPAPPDAGPDAAMTDCGIAWAGGKGLSRCDATPDNYIVVRKSKRNLDLCAKGATVSSFHVGLGFAPVGDKEKQGDGKTPEGAFYIPRLVPDSSYYKAFLVSYPDKDDAARGLAAGLISADETSQIDAAQDACLEPPQETGLGGLIELHGNGGSQDWTHGCIAVEDKEIDQLWGSLGVGDTIIILP